MKNLSPLSIFNISLPKGTSELIGWRRFQSTKLDSELHFGDAYRNQSMGAVAGDFDGDGCIDIFVANYQQRNTLLVGNCQGDFAPAEAGQATEFETYSAQVVALDADGDGHLDIFEACR